MGKEYIISFSSFYKAAYPQDMLREAGISASLRRLPAELARSCSTGVYLKTSSAEDVMSVFERKQIKPRGIYQISRDEKGKKKYIMVP